MLYFSPSNHKTLLRAWWKVETRWLDAVEWLRSIVYSRCRCDDTDNTAPSDIETSNRNIEFNDAMNVIMLCIEMCLRVCGEQKKLGGWFPRMLSVATGPNVIIFKV